MIYSIRIIMLLGKLRGTSKNNHQKTDFLCMLNDRLGKKSTNNIIVLIKFIFSLFKVAYNSFD